MAKPKDFYDLKRILEERGDKDLAEAILPLEEIAPLELIERYPTLKNLALVALSELEDEEIEDVFAEWDEEGEPEGVEGLRRIIGLPNLTEKASMCELIDLDDLINWLKQHGVHFEGDSDSPA